MIRKKQECFTCLKEVYVLRPIKAQNMAMSVHYLHRHEKGADEPIILVEEV